MIYRGFLAIVACLCLCLQLPAQISRDAKFEILRTIIADQAAARIAMPFGTEGLELSESGEINKDKLEKEIKKNGQSVEPGKVVSVTDISFADDKIELELDGGGKNKKSFVDRIQIGVGTGNTTTPVPRDDKTKKAKGSKIVLKFAKKVPQDLKPEALKELLAPVLDFNKHNFLKTGIDALPPEFQEAVKAKEAKIGMDRSTVIMALGRPDKKVREKKDGADVEDWIYFQRGLRAKFVTFENNVVVRIAEY
jgi:hypothetical protein